MKAEPQSAPTCKEALATVLSLLEPLGDGPPRVGEEGTGHYPLAEARETAREALASPCPCEERVRGSRAERYVAPRYCDEATDSGHSSANGLDSR